MTTYRNPVQEAWFNWYNAQVAETKARVGWQLDISTGNKWDEYATHAYALRHLSTYVVPHLSDEVAEALAQAHQSWWAWLAGFGLDTYPTRFPDMLLLDDYAAVLGRRAGVPDVFTTQVIVDGPTQRHMEAAGASEAASAVTMALIQALNDGNAALTEQVFDALNTGRLEHMPFVQQIAHTFKRGQFVGDGWDIRPVR